MAALRSSSGLFVSERTASGLLQLAWPIKEITLISVIVATAATSWYGDRVSVTFNSVLGALTRLTTGKSSAGKTR